MVARVTRRPNVLLIIADDMGYGDFGAMNPVVRTPNLDALMAQGTCLRQHYTASPICAPARAGLITGRYPHRTGAITQHEIHGLDRIALREVTMADMYRHAGYATGLVGKWHNGTFDPRFEPNARGYNEFVGFCGGWSDYYDYELRVNDSRRRSDGRYMTEVLTDEAIAFVDRHRDEPFFLQLAYSAPHSPFQAPEGAAEPYLDQGFNRVVGTTYAMIELMDRGIGRLLQQLDNLRLTENTIVLFTSDNGPAFFNPPYMLEPGEATTNERFNCGLRGAKAYVYEGGIRVPMIVRFPSRVPAGVWNDQLVHFVDWLPTLLAMTGVDRLPGPALDGRDVSVGLLGGSVEGTPQQFWQWNFYLPYVGTNAAVREENWKLVRPMIAGTRFFAKNLYPSEVEEAKMRAFVEADLLHKKDPGAVREVLPVPRIRMPPPEPPELYDLAADPFEQNNLADAHPDRVSRMLSSLETWFEDIEAERLTIPGAQRE
jgi:arylsulfatase A-like enzyme